MITKILVGTDGSEGAVIAASTAAFLAKGAGASVTILNVFATPVFPIHTSLPSVAVNAAILESAASIQDAVARRTGKVLDEADVEYTVRNEVGSPPDVIVRIAKEEAFDLIVVGSSGMSEYGALLLGSVSHAVAQRSHCPVLISRRAP